MISAWDKTRLRGGRLGRAALAGLLAFALVGGEFTVPDAALADEAGAATAGLNSSAAADTADAAQDVPEAQKTAFELAEQVESTKAAYEEALLESERADAEVAVGEARIAELEQLLPMQQKRSSQAARDLYKYQQRAGGVVEMLLAADDFFDFLNELEYVNRIAELNVDEMNRLSQVKAELADTQRGLLAKQSEASARSEEARAAMEAAEEAQAEADRRAAEEAALAAEVAALAAAMAEEPRENDEGAIANAPEVPAEAETTQNTSSAAGATVAAAPVAVEVSGDEAAFVASWAARIDAYLAGSPLAGQGRTFAQAAWNYGVDPRFSPAISATESSKGRYCFKPHNAWGWGSASWGSWEEAIDAHVRGLSRGYGYTISVEGARKYCPPNWEFWYNATSAQMNLI